MSAKDNLEEKFRKDGFIGEQTDVADSEKVDSTLVKERIRTENNNPRDPDGPQD